MRYRDTLRQGQPDVQPMRLCRDCIRVLSRDAVLWVWQ